MQGRTLDSFIFSTLASIDNNGGIVPPAAAVVNKIEIQVFMDYQTLVNLAFMAAAIDCQMRACVRAYVRTWIFVFVRKISLLRIGPDFICGRDLASPSFSFFFFLSRSHSRGDSKSINLIWTVRSFMRGVPEEQRTAKMNTRHTRSGGLT